MPDKGITISLIHDDGEIGKSWRKFMEEMFTTDLPENYRDLGLDIKSESLKNLDEEGVVESIQSAQWKLFLFSHTMYNELNNEKATLLESDLFETNPEQIIILILAEVNDTSFIKDVRKSLCVFSGFLSFHLVNATSPEKILSDIIATVSPMYIVFHPNVLSSEDQEQHITLVANKSFPSAEGVTFRVVFNEAPNSKELEATLFNPCTLLLQNPGLPPGVMDVRVYACPPCDREEAVEDDTDCADSRIQLGDVMKVWIQSDLDKVNSILEKNNNPFHFLCQALQVDPNNPKAVDIVDENLTESFRNHVPEDQLRIFGTQQGADGEGSVGNSKEFAPTLLHFSATHGLRNLTALLLRCPGAVRAFGTANCDGDYPTTLAEKYGHWELKHYMQSYMEVSAMVDYEVKSTQSTSQMMAQMVTGRYLSVNESIYGSNQDDPGTLPGYVPMKPVDFANDVNEVNYDRPFLVPIPSADNTPNYESILAQMIESNEETYMTFGNPEQDSLFSSHGSSSSWHEEAPPRPPRDHLPSDSYALPAAPPPPSENPPPLPPTENPPPLPPERPENNQSIKPRGADRVSYQSLAIPKVHSYVSPAQRELIILQQKVKNKELTTNQAVSRFKEWERKHKEQAASFQFQQECLQRVRNSLMKSKELKRQKGEDDSLEITKPIVAGSSTYDAVLRKTNESDPSEVIYASGKKPMKPDDGFRKPLADPYSRTENFYTTGTSSTTDKRPIHRPPPVPPRDDSSAGPVPYVPPRPHGNW